MLFTCIGNIIYSLKGRFRNNIKSTVPIVVMMLEPMKFCEPVCITGNSLSNSNSKTKIDQLKEVESPKYPDAKHAEPDFAHSHMSHQT